MRHKTHLQVEGKRIYKVFVGSPGDTAEERKICEKVTLKLQKAGMPIELYMSHDATSNANGERGQAHINRQLLQECDVVIGIMSLRYGMPTGVYDSGTEEEFEVAFRECRITGKQTPRIIFYFKKHDFIPAEYTEQHNKVRAFRERFASEALGLYTEFKDGAEFQSLLERDLPKAIKELDERLLSEVPRTSNLQFVGRKKELEALPRLLSEGHIVFEAQSGMGKTTLVQCLCRNSDSVRQGYSAIRWISINRDILSQQDSTAFRQAFIAKFSPSSIDGEESNESSVNWTKKFNDCVENDYRIPPSQHKKRLLVIDNLDYISEEDFEGLGQLLTNDYGWRVLITSRGLKELQDIAQVYSLGPLTEADGVSLFKKVYKSRGGLGFSKEPVQHFIKQLGCNTAVIGVAAAHATLADAGSLEDYCANAVKYLPQAGDLGEFFRDTLALLPKQEKQLLVFMIALTASPISREMLKQLLDSCFNGWGALLSSLVVKQLVTASEQKETKGGKDKVYYQCHSIIGTYYKPSPEITADELRPIVQSLLKKMDWDEINPWTKVIDWLPYAESVLNCVALEAYDDEMLSLAYNHLRTSRAAAVNKHSYQETIVYITDLIKYSEYKRNKSLLAWLYKLKGNVIANDGSRKDKKEALLHREKSLKLIQELRKETDDEELIRREGEINDFIGRSYRTLDEYELAEKHYKSSIKLLSSLASDRSKITLAVAYDHWGLVYSDKGKQAEKREEAQKEYKESLRLRKIALGIKEGALGNHTPSYIATWNNYARTLHNLGKCTSDKTIKEQQYARTIKEYKGIQEKREKIYPKGHPNLAYSYNNLTSVYIDRGKPEDFEEAIKYNRMAMDILQKSKSFPNKRKATVYNYAAQVLMGGGFLIQAKHYNQEALLLLKEYSTEDKVKEAEKRAKKIDELKKNFRELEKEYYDYTKSLKLSNDLKPTNLGKEWELFFEALKRGERYNPQFSYAIRTNEEVCEIIATLQGLRERFKTARVAILSDSYCELIDKDIRWVQLMHQRSSEGFGQELAKLHQAITPNILEQAKRVISEFDPEEEHHEPSQSIDALEAKRRFKKALDERGYINWRIELLEQPARVAVNSLEQKIKIHRDALFTEEDIQRLIVHEIEVHIARFEQGCKQPYLIFAYGLPDYLETEEGLAIYNEELNGLSSKRKIYDYATRLILCDKALEMSFFELYQEALLLYPSDQERAYGIAVRIKRGLTDTSVHGGYTKDQVYFSGYLAVKALSDAERGRLWIGKIGIDDIPNVTKLLNLEMW